MHGTKQQKQGSHRYDNKRTSHCKCIDLLKLNRPRPIAKIAIFCIIHAHHHTLRPHTASKTFVGALWTICSYHVRLTFIFIIFISRPLQCNLRYCHNVSSVTPCQLAIATKRLHAVYARTVLLVSLTKK